jgi:acyl dehydratase
MNPAVAGKTYPEATFIVETTHVTAFRELFGETAGVPPTFVTAAEFSVMPQIVGDPELGLAFSRVLHGSQEFTFQRPLREGETLRVRTRIDAIRVLGANAFLSIVTDLVADGDEVVCTARSTMIERGEN